MQEDVMIEIEEFEKMLDEIADELPQEFYKELNGGILLLPRAKTNPVGGAKTFTHWENTIAVRAWAGI